MKKVIVILLGLSVGVALAAAPNVDVELEKQALVKLVKAGDWAAMQAKVDSMRARGIDLGTEIIYFEGRGAMEQGNLSVADARFTQYIKQSDGKGHYYSKALADLGQIREKEQAAKAEAAAKAKAAAAQADWMKNGVVGQIKTINADWGFVTLEISDAAKMKEPVQVLHGGTVLELGKLKALSDGGYSATVKGGVTGVAVGDPVYTCCAPVVPK